MHKTFKKIIFLTFLSGVTSTISMDLINKITSTIHLIPALNIYFIGNMLSQWMEGDFIFSHPSEIATNKNGLLIGYFFHYFAGIALAFPYCWLFFKTNFISNLSVFKTAVYGLICSLITLVFIYPSVGLGLWGMKSGNYELLIAALINHFVYGLALLASCIFITRILLNKTHSV